MPYVFTRTDDYVIIEHAIDQYYAVTRASANVLRQTNNISISGGFSLNFSYLDIGTIDGITPISAEDATRKLGLIFKGYPHFKMTIEQ